jgi:hypothetical protein
MSLGLSRRSSVAGPRRFAPFPTTQAATSPMRISLAGRPHAAPGDGASTTEGAGGDHDAAAEAAAAAVHATPAHHRRSSAAARMLGRVSNGIGDALHWIGSMGGKHDRGASASTAAPLSLGGARVRGVEHAGKPRSPAHARCAADFTLHAANFAVAQKFPPSLKLRTQPPHLAVSHPLARQR